jgi:hypothetical protein
MLNRYGLFEMDAGVRKAERRWKESGADEDKQAFIQRSLRAGGHHARRAHDLIMEPHVARYRKAAEAHERAQTAGSGERGMKLRDETRKTRDEASQNLHDHASDLGRHAGEFLGKVKGETPYDHIHRLATLHGTGHYYTRSFDDGSHRFQFWREPRVASQHATLLHRSIQHHYPHWKSEIHDWLNGNHVYHKASVRFTPEKHKFHEPHDLGEES